MAPQSNWATGRVPHFPTGGTRRDFLLRSGGGLGALALAWLLRDDRALGRARASELPATEDPAAPRPPHFAPRAKRVVWLFMHGGPSQVDLFDPKPDLIKYAGKPPPASVHNMIFREVKTTKAPILPPARPFRPRGESGIEVSDFLPHIAECVDDLCVIRSCQCDSVNHAQAILQTNTGSILTGKASMGSWLGYGLGTENQNMPAFVVLPDPHGWTYAGPGTWGSGFLPAAFQGTLMRSGPSPVLNLQPQEQITESDQRASLELMQRFNRRHLAEREFDDDLAARVSAYELAYRMQSTAPDVVDLTGETRETLQMYGIGEKDSHDYGTRCLLARRMLERGVRMVQVISGHRPGWDAHNDLDPIHSLRCRETDKPVAGLLKDLKRRGLLEDTLVIWGGEFGRTPMSERTTGRDHNPYGYTMWLAGAGVKAGMVYGATDSLGLWAVENNVHIRDLHATILHLLGLDHELLTYFHHGRDERLTDVGGRVVEDILS